MTYELAIGDRMYSSWSLRGWLSFAAFNIPYKLQTCRMYSASFEDMKQEFAPTQLVPAAKLDGTPCWDSLAIIEELASRHPDAVIWPEDPAARAFARAMVAEMHSGFTALRSACAMNLRHAYGGFEAPEKVQQDCARIDMLWSMAKAQFGQSGPWLFGTYSAADVFFAPVAMRFAGYGLPRSDLAEAYINAHLAEPNFRRWRAMAFANDFVQPGYDLDLPKLPWPGPTPLEAKDAGNSASVNATCPYSGKSVTHSLELDGVIYGFCNEFCRDKTLYDPEAWPDFIALVAKHR
jgi:glutathione S-transferase